MRTAKGGWLALCGCLSKRGAELAAQSFGGQAQDVLGGISRCGANVVAHRTVVVQNPILPVHEHDRRSKPLDQRLLGDWTVTPCTTRYPTGRRKSQGGASVLGGHGEIQAARCRRIDPPVDTPLLGYRCEKRLLLSDRLRASEKKKATIRQGKMEQPHQPILIIRLDVDQQVSAGNQVDVGKGWIGHQVLGREYDSLA